MPLSPEEHQKIAVLSQVAALVSQAASVAGNQHVLTNVSYSLLPLVDQWRSDPNFVELGILLRQAAISNTPSGLNDLIAFVNGMMDKFDDRLQQNNEVFKLPVDENGNSYKWNAQFAKRQTSPLYDPKEPVRTYSHMGWQGSQKYPFGIAFQNQWTMSGFESNKNVRNLVLSLGLGFLISKLVK